LKKEKKKKKIKINRNFKALFKKPLFYIGLIQVVASIFLVGIIISIGILGLKYLIPIILLIILIDFLILFFLYKKKGKKTRIVLGIISVIFSIVSLVGGAFLNQTFASVNKMFKNNSYINYSVLVHKENKNNKIQDIDEKIVGYYVDDKYNEEAQKVLNKKISVEYIGYSSVQELENALLEKEIDAIMIMDSYLELDDNEEMDTSLEKVDVSDFEDNSKVIYTFKVKVDHSKKTKKIDLEKGSFAIYVSGQDSYASSVSETSRSDVNLLMVVNLKSKQVLLVSIPRDYYIKINSKGAYDKLTHISLYGSEEAAKSIGSLLDVSIDYYVKFNFTTFMKAVEYMLPLDVYSDYDFTTSVYDQTIGNSYSFSKGYNHITSGEMALQFVRARKNFAEGDRQRGINQARFLRAVINKASTPSILLKYNKILNALEGTFLTNISDESIVEIIKYVLNHNGSFKINSISLDGSDASRSTYSGGSQALYVMIPNSKTVEDAKEQIQCVFDGGVPDIPQDASELADVKDTHKVTSKDIGKTYVPASQTRPTITVPKEEKKDEPEKIDEEENKEDEEGKVEDNPTTNPGDGEQTEPGKPTDEPSSEPSDNPSQGSEEITPTPSTNPEQNVSNE